MSTRSLKIVCFQLAKNRRHLPPNDAEHFQFRIDRAVFVCQASSKRVRIAAKECGALFGNYAFHAIGIDRFEVRKVANDLSGGPFAYDGPGIYLLITHPADSLFNKI